MNMKKIDKKQVPQFAALCVVTAGVFGYGVVHLVMPGPASAGTRPAALAHPAAVPVPAAGAGPLSAAVPAAAGAAVASTDIPDAPPPSTAMHNPFAVGYVDPASAPAAIAAVTPVKAPALPKLPASGKKIAGLGALAPLPVGPSAPALPGSLSLFPVRSSVSLPGGVARLPGAPAALPAAPAAPSWTVTGVLLGAAEKVAILRNGDARRIVRAGDFVDSTYRVMGVTRTSVVLRHGAAVYLLMLGGAKAESVPAALPSAPASAPMPRSAAVMDSTLAPVHPAHLPLAHLKHQEQVRLVAEAPLSVPVAAFVPATAASVSPAKVAAASLGLRLLDGSVLAQGRKK